MCSFLSLVETDRHEIYLFTPEQRIAHSKKPLTDKHGNEYNMDSHASICAFYGLDEDAVNKYEWNPYTQKLDIDQKTFDLDEKRVLAYLEGIDWHPICGDIKGMRDFLERLKKVPFFKRCGRLPEGVKLFQRRDAAWAASFDAARAAASAAARAAALDAALDAAWYAARAAALDAALDAARDVAWDAAWGAALDATLAAARAAARAAALYADVTFVCSGLPIKQDHVDHVKKRWAVWEAGYGVACDVGGVLYCYERP